jgi:phosphonopyruvate decarboxylase
LGIKFLIINSDKDIKKIQSIVKFAKKTNSPVAILVKKNSLSEVKIKTQVIKKNAFKRSDFLKCLLFHLKNSDKIISTTGYTSRELYQIRKNNSKFKGKDFYMVGGMGHALSVAQGMALSSKNRIICLDGDGSLIMHLGSMHTSGNINSQNLKHILLNNTCHESVGGQTTYSKNINFKKLSSSVGYKNYFHLSSENNNKKKIKEFLLSSGPSFLEVKISKGKINPLGRPKNFINIKKKFIK